MRKVLNFLILAALLAAGLGGPAASPAQAADNAVNAIPDTVIASGVTSYSLAVPKIFWHSNQVPTCPIPDPQPPNLIIPPIVIPNEFVRRIASYGSPVRNLYAEYEDCNQSKILSNVVADTNYVYWLTANGLYRLSVDANPGDAPQLMNALLKGPGELADGGDRIYTIDQDSVYNFTEVSYVYKTPNYAHIELTAAANAWNLQTDGTYVFYMVGTNLYRIEPGVDSGILVSTGVTGYYDEGYRFGGCTLISCFYTNQAFVAKSGQVFRYNNNNKTLGATAIYNSVDATATIYSLVSDSTNLFLFESRQAVCEPFCTYLDVLERTGRSSEAGKGDLYSYGPSFVDKPDHLTTDGSLLYWQEAGALKRLWNNAAAIPPVNVYVTGMEVTQGIQNASNSVVLIKDRPTFVRVFVKSTGGSVPGVTAVLTTRAAVGIQQLSPVNPVGTTITVRGTPNQNDINQSFLFELPWDWTHVSSLDLHVNVNPYKVPLETSYADNTYDLPSNVTFQNSPSLSVEFFNLNYTIGGKTYSPRYVQDVLKTYSWILRAYPLGGAVGDYFKPRLWDVDGGTTLGSYVNRTSPKCTQVYSNPKDDVALCASYFMNGWLWYYRVATMFGQLNVGLNVNAFYYGMISDESNNFPRGQAIYNQTSVGPAGTPGKYFGLGQGWDTDGSYADWYAAHEIGHSLGRAHPNAGSDDPATPNTTENCGHSRSDPSFPYGNTSTARAPIGSGGTEGFDRGDAYFGIPMSVLPNSVWNDVMSYCSNQWISDYTYTGMFNYMTAHPSQVAADQMNDPQVGDFLLVAGSIDPANAAADFSMVRRLNNVVNVPALVPGAYKIRLLNAANGTLAEYAFTPSPIPDTTFLGFGQVVNFAAGTRSVQIVQTNNNAVLGSFLVSANAPVVSGVALQGAPNPVKGVVTLNWNASDADNDLLTYDVAYSRDGGQTFQPVAVNISAKTAQIDSAKLGGSGTAMLRVTASDGVNTGYADSAVFNMSNKAPQPVILDPAVNTQVHYGQLVNFNGFAQDAQDGLVASSGLVWMNAAQQTLGGGPTLSLASLPVGTNRITLQATNSLNLSASAVVTVTVDDNLDLPGPTLSAGPLQAGWQINAGVKTLQTADITISNSGSGSLDWTAVSNQPWLTLSAPSGTVSSSGDPSVLTLSADPTGLLSGHIYIAKVTLDKAGGGSPVTILVTLAIGDIQDTPVQKFSGFTIYTPLIRR